QGALEEAGSAVENRADAGRNPATDEVRHEQRYAGPDAGSGAERAGVGLAWLGRAYPDRDAERGHQEQESERDEHAAEDSAPGHAHTVGAQRGRLGDAPALGHTSVVVGVVAGYSGHRVSFLLRSEERRV